MSEVNFEDLTCHQCQPAREFQLKKQLRQHTYDYHPKDPASLRCILCPKVFNSVSHRRNHEKNHCPNRAALLAPPLAQPQIYTCDRCVPPRGFTNKLAYINHVGGYHPQDTSKLRCRFCNKVCVSTKTCRSHEKYNCPNNPNGHHSNPLQDDSVTCTECDPPKVLKNLRVFQKHNSEYHPQDVTKLKCKFCQRKFASTDTRQKHETNFCPQNQARRKPSKRFTKPKAQQPALEAEKDGSIENKGESWASKKDSDFETISENEEENEETEEETKENQENEEDPIHQDTLNQLEEQDHEEEEENQNDFLFPNPKRMKLDHHLGFTDSSSKEVLDLPQELRQNSSGSIINELENTSDTIKANFENGS